VDVRLAKKWKLWTEARSGSNRDLEFRFDAFNVLNHSNYSNVVGTMTSPFFGRPTAALPGRTLQVGTSFKF
jgi:hypothetical protein